MNIALRIAEVAKKMPHKKSVVFSRAVGNSYEYPFYTFEQFEARSSQMAHFFLSIGIKKGMRTLLFVKPCLDFSVITFALFKIGAVPVLIDPGMGVKNLLNSIQQVAPEAFISIPKGHWLRRLKSSYFHTVKINIAFEEMLNTFNLYEKLETFSTSFPPVEVSDTDQSAILFTSGGTGTPKGVIYNHGIMNAQTDALKEMFHLDETQTDLPAFPLFALFTLAMGMTSVIPDMDPTKPSQCDPKKLVKNILDNQITFVAGSPAIWERVGQYCVKHKIQLGSLKHVVMFGAPVRAEIHQLFKKVLTTGDTYTPYGATECLPVSLISGSEVLGGKYLLTLQGEGTCIGQAVPGVSIKIIKTSDIPENELHELPAGNYGEIIVSGKQVTPAYFEMREETHKAKILVAGKLWHRMGDMGYLDAENNLWFLGRKSHLVETNDQVFFPIQVEAIFNQHPQIRRTALISINKDGATAPGLVIERHDGQTKMPTHFLKDVMQLGGNHEKSRFISDFFLSSAFPVDIRHNIKIDRLKLSSWAREGGFTCLKQISKRFPGSST